MCGVDYDFEPVGFHRKQRVRARKAHICIVCGRRIDPGEKYCRQVYEQDGLHNEKACRQCADIVDDFERDHGFWPSFGSIDMFLDECLQIDREERNAAAVRKWARAQRAIRRKHVPLGWG